MSRKNNKKDIQYKTLLSVLANGSTDKARELLIKHSGEDAQDTKDLQVKLARLYAISTSKPELEKAFAEIHPHKDFILKYTKAVEELKPLQEETLATSKDNVGEGKMVVVHDGYANACGDGGCGCQDCMKKRIGISDFVNASGSEQPLSVLNNGALILGIVSVVAMFGVLVYYKNNK